eukprot:SAG22_NODE_205_length_15308_cov_20.539023_15_plen_120_part_00
MDRSAACRCLPAWLPAAFGVELLQKLEEAGAGANLDTLDFQPEGANSLCVGWVLGLMFGQAFFYSVLGWYFDQVRDARPIDRLIDGSIDEWMARLLPPPFQHRVAFHCLRLRFYVAHSS